MNELVRKVIQLVEDDLSQVPSLERIATKLGTSRYFLSRIIKDELGESFTEYVKRRRLSQAAREIQMSNRRILDVALEYGYSSEEAFNRSFKGLHGGTPKRAKFHHAQLFKRSALEVIPQKSMSCEIKRYGGVKLRALGKKLTYDDFEGINCFWSDFHSRHPEVTGETYGISLPIDNNEPEGFYYLIAFDPRFEIDQSFLVEIPEKDYAIFKHEGKAQNLMSSFNYIWGNWIYQNSQYKVSGMDFEVYPKNYNPNDDTGHCFIYLPISI